MLENLASVIEGLRVPLDGAMLVQVLALRDRLEARLAVAVGDFDAGHLWDLDAA
ncbi:MAG: hypothetical protein QOG43_2999, partial [Actinomycetota bacterium]|nr:hypothetical protein [Actinomycetota bacterium]